MAIRIDLTPEEEARLREHAEQRGQPLERLAGELLRTLLSSTGNGSSAHLKPVVDDTGVFHQDRWERVLASIQAGSSGAPVLPAAALTREALYSDHD
jgi:hypothetical protein